MRRLTLALSVSLVLAPTMSAQQTQTPPSRPTTPAVSTPTPPPAAPSIATPSPQTSRASTTPPRDVQAIVTYSAASAGTQNVALEIKISDSFTTEVQTTKVVSMLVADGQSGQIRAGGGETVSVINVDARPAVQRDGRIRLQLTVEYRPDLTLEQMEQLVKSNKGSFRPNVLTESLTLVVADSKKTLVSQSSDPRSDRKVSLEVTATVVK